METIRKKKMLQFIASCLQLGFPFPLSNTPTQYNHRNYFVWLWYNMYFLCVLMSKKFQVFTYTENDRNEIRFF